MLPPERRRPCLAQLDKQRSEDRLAGPVFSHPGACNVTKALDDWTSLPDARVSSRDGSHGSRQGLAGISERVAAPFVAVAHIYFNSIEDLRKSLVATADSTMADIPNFTDVEPSISDQ